MLALWILRFVLDFLVMDFYNNAIEIKNRTLIYLIFPKKEQISVSKAVNQSCSSMMSNRLS